MNRPNFRHATIIATIVAGVLAVSWTALTLRDSQPMKESPVGIARLQEFTLPDLDGRPRSLSEWSGSPLILNFWATWCAPCRREMPMLQDIHDHRSEDGLTVIGIALDNPRDAGRFASEIGISYPILVGEADGAEIADSFGDSFVGLPFTAILGPGGEIVALRAGELRADELKRIVTDLNALVGGRLTPDQVRDRLTEH